MTSETQAIFEAAAKLPERDRLQLAERLLETLPAELSEMRDDEFEAELERRNAEYEKDPSLGVPWAEVKRQL
jgi:putative addiction module component (TIGR02574 family)